MIIHLINIGLKKKWVGHPIGPETSVYLKDPSNHAPAEKTAGA
jgi:hypothetical protein